MAVNWSLAHLNISCIQVELPTKVEAMQSPRNVAHARLDVVGDPLDKVGRVLVLDVDRLLIHFLVRAPYCWEPRDVSGGKPDHEEVEARKGDEVDCKLPQIEVQLAWEPQAACDPAHGRSDQVVEISNSKQLETKALDCAQSQLSIHTVAVLK
ncbi:hypothetical protein SAY86_031897 [Trapa natans]|uniref:Uncharacterized protein n=1 Tax=Trapa natans TaxID=22666 RepID=A0AAN7LTJ7_TRANT|nr:hypothetical protein SAY86_031897 [Trapa natans]